VRAGPWRVSKAITAPAAARLLGSIAPAGAVEVARCELAAAFVDDLRRIDGQMRETRKKLTTAVQAAGTSLTRLFGVGPVIAGAVIGDVRDVSRFLSRDHFAAYNGTAPVELSSGQRTPRAARPLSSVPRLAEYPARRGTMSVSGADRRPFGLGAKTAGTRGRASNAAAGNEREVTAG
jgi:transposase